MKRIAGIIAVVLAAAALPGAARAETEQLSPDEVRRVVNAHAHEVRTCYEKHAMKQKEATGKVLLDLVVRASGDVSEVDVEAEGVRGRKFERCVESRASKWRFPESREATEVQYPFLFQHTRKG